LYVKFDVPVYATELLIRETLHVGFVRKVYFIDESDNQILVYEGSDSTSSCPQNFQVTLSAPTTYKVTGANITIESTEWASVDSVQLVGYTELNPKQLSLSVDNLNLIMEEGEDTIHSTNLTDTIEYTKPPGLTGAGAAFIGATMYMYGGSMGRGLFSDLLYKYSVSQNQWSLVSYHGDISPGKRGSVLMAAVGTDLFLFGGFNAEQLIEERGTLWVYDSLTSTWTLRAKTATDTSTWPWTRTGTHMLSIPSTNKIVFFGGRTKFLYVNDVWTYDTVDRSWTLLFNYTTTCSTTSSCPIGRQDAVIDSWTYQGTTYLIVAGGYTVDQGPMSDVWLFNTQKKTWTRVAFNPLKNPDLPSGRFNHAGAVINDVFFMFGGITKDGLTRDYYQLDLKQVIQNLPIWKRLNVPATREGFISFFYEDSFFIHGGRNGDTFYSDMWEFDLNTKEWYIVESENRPTIECAYHSVVRYSNKLLIFGGLAAYGPLNDLYEYDLLLKKWIKINVEGAVPPPRYSHVAGIFGREMIIHAGVGNGPLSDMWIFNLPTNVWTPAAGTVWKGNTRKQSGLIIGDYLYSFGGEDSHQGPQTFVNRFDLQMEYGLRNFYTDEVPEWKTVWNLEKAGSGNILFASSSATIVNKNQALILGGTFPSDPSTTSYSTSIRLFDSQTNRFHYYMNLSPGRASSGIEQEQNSIYVFGGKSMLGPLNDLWMVTTKEICAADNINDRCLQCVPGYRVVQLASGKYSCEQCSPGFYSDEFHTTTCSPCPAGFTSNEKVMYGFDQCVPCPYGTINVKEGDTNNCLQCNGTSEFCPLASLVKLPMSYSVDIHRPLVTKPKAEENIAYKTNVAVLICILSIGVLGAFVVFVFVVVRVLHPSLSRRVFKHFDVFSRCHSFQIRTPLFLKKTTLGGTFTLIFLLVWMALFLALLIPYIFDNYDEIRTLNPAIYSNVQVNATMELSVVLPGYTGECTNEGTTITPFQYGWTFDSETKIVKKIQKEGRTDCSVVWTCKNCNMFVQESFVTLSFQEERAYTSVIQWKASIDSAIPAIDSTGRYADPKAGVQKMIIEGSALPYSKDRLFRGGQPTRVKFVVFPTTFQSWRGYSKSSPTTGYQFEYLETEKGSTVDRYTFHHAQNFDVLFQFRRSDNILNIRSSEKVSLQTFISTMLGATFGLFAAFCVILIVFEDALKFVKVRVFKMDKKKARDEDDDYEGETEVSSTGYVLFKDENTEMIDRRPSIRKHKNLNSYIRAEVKRTGYSKVANFDLKVVDPDFYTPEVLGRVHQRRSRRRHAIFIPPPPTAFYYTTFDADSDSENDNDFFTNRMDQEVSKIQSSRSFTMSDRTDRSTSIHMSNGRDFWDE
jgi:hypothetical protein